MAQRRAVCALCGETHQRLGIKIVGDVMVRWVDRERHMLRLGGGAWAFKANLIDGHPEIARYEVTDETGLTYRVDRATMEQSSYRRDLGRGEQVILPHRYWSTDGAMRSLGERLVMSVPLVS